MGGRLKNLFNSAMYLMFGLGGIFVNVISIWFNSYKFYLWLNLACVLVSSLAYFYFIESPFYYHKKREILKLYECLMSIARINKPPQKVNEIKESLRAVLKLETNESNRERNDLSSSNLNQIKTKVLLTDLEEEIPANDEESVKSEKSTPHKLAFLNLFRPANLWIFLNYLILLTYLQLVWNLSLNINKDLGIDNVYLNGVLINGLEVVSYVFCLSYFHRFKRRTINISTSILATILAGALLVVDLVSNHSVAYSDRSQLVRVIETSSLNSLGTFSHVL